MHASKFKLGVVCIFQLFLFHISQAQNDTTRRPFILGAKAHYGFIIPHTEKIEQLSNSNPYGIEISFSLLNNRAKDWKQCNCYSQTGLLLSYINFDNPEILGSSVNLLIFVEPFITFNPRLFFTARMGAGLSYITKIYDENTNPTNLFFSTPISIPLFAELNMKYKINSKFNLSLGGSYNHISNGGYKQPNLGMNFPTANLGIEYMFRPAALLSPPKVTAAINKKPYFEINVLYSQKVLGETDSFPEKTCHILGLSARVNRNLSRYNALSAGVEWIASGYNKESISRQNLDVDYNRLALTAGHNLLVGKFAFVIQFGFYVYDPYEAMDDVYQKYDLRYHISKHFYAGVFLKAHLQVAELMGVCAGVLL